MQVKAHALVIAAVVPFGPCVADGVEQAAGVGDAAQLRQHAVGGGERVVADAVLTQGDVGQGSLVRRMAGIKVGDGGVNLGRGFIAQALVVQRGHAKQDKLHLIGGVLRQLATGLDIGGSLKRGFEAVVGGHQVAVAAGGELIGQSNQQRLGRRGYGSIGGHFAHQAFSGAVVFGHHVFGGKIGAVQRFGHAVRQVQRRGEFADRGKLKPRAPLFDLRDIALAVGIAKGDLGHGGLVPSPGGAGLLQRYAELFPDRGHNIL